MKTYDIAQQIKTGRLQWVAYGLAILVVVLLLVAIFVPHGQGSHAIVYVDGRQVADFALAETDRVVRYNGIEVRVYNNGVQTVVDGRVGTPINKVGETLVYPAQGVTICIQ